MFAKLYETPTDQILVMRDTNDKGDPCVSFITDVEAIGRIVFNLNFEDTDAGHDQADDAFANTDEAAARQVMAEALATLLPAFQQS